MSDNPVFQSPISPIAGKVAAGPATSAQLQQLALQLHDSASRISPAVVSGLYRLSECLLFIAASVAVYVVYINDYITRTGTSPSFDEMKEALDLKSKSGIHRLITGLEERGFIRRLPHRARALEVVRMPETAAYGVESETPARNQKLALIEGGKESGGLTGRPVVSNSAMIDLPLHGKIAAGTPIEALRDTSTFVEVPPSLLGRGEHYALEVDGDSMIEAGIT